MAAHDFESQTAPDPKEWHFLAHYYRLLARILHNLRRLTAEINETDRTDGLLNMQRFLDAYIDFLQRVTKLPLTEQDAWWKERIAAFEANNPQHLPLRVLRQEADYTPMQINVLLVAGLVEEDIRFGTVFGQLQSPLEQRYPCLGLLGLLLSTEQQPLDDAWLLAKTLIENKYVSVLNPTDSRAEWALRVPIPIWDALRGRQVSRPLPGVSLQLKESFPPIEALILPAETGSRLRSIPASILAQEIDVLVIRGLPGSGRRTALGSLARALNRDTLLCESLTPETRPIIGPLATLTAALPVLNLNPGPSETADVPSLAGYDGVIGVRMGKSGGLQGIQSQRLLTETLPAPDPDARRRFWEATEVPIKEGESDAIVQHFLLTGGLIHRVAGMARAVAHQDRREEITADDVQVAARNLNRQMLDTLTTALEPLEGWHNLVVSDSVQRELQVLEIRCAQREHLQDATGRAYEHNLNRGVRAMFSGPSGTGKTFAARALAAALKKDIYRINLDATVSKYIGDTPRNLNEVFNAAESLDVVLLADEGDGLMTRRTDVSNSNDRYANLETNYLLQRLEAYEGIIIITTNAAQRIDSAFLRRLDVIVEFTRPEWEERLALWRVHLPANHAIDQAVLRQAAERAVLTGGQIRNATLYMAMLALEDQSLINEAHLQAALEREYRKAGMSAPVDPAASPGKQQDRLRHLTNLLGIHQE
jgi:energy-coupling factor transporter ATP-binding protein EcfA2